MNVSISEQAVSEPTYKPVDKANEVNLLLDTLHENDLATLALAGDEQKEWKVAVKQARLGGLLLLDISSLHDDIQLVQNDQAFHFIWFSDQGLTRTPELTFSQTWEEDGHTYAQCNFPKQLEINNRRKHFRAKLADNMKIRACLSDPYTCAFGWIEDLSVAGCRIDFEASAVMLLHEVGLPLDLEMQFTDGTTLHLNAWPRNHAFDGSRIHCGIYFELKDQDDEQILWKILRETEQEIRRNATHSSLAEPTTTLFNGEQLDMEQQTNADFYTMEATRKLAKQADALATQIIRLRENNNLDLELLHDCAEELLLMHKKDRQSLLFALSCLDSESPLICHCLAVAVRLLDVATTSDTSWALRKAIVAATLVHDLGKALLPSELTWAKQWNASTQKQLARHIALLRSRMPDSPWLPAKIVDTLIGNINERIDGSGYPSLLEGEKLNHLARLAAVVDVVDAMGRQRPDREALPLDDIYNHLWENTSSFDPACIKTYIRHFGQWPIGSLVEFANGKFGWIMAYDTEGKLDKIKVVTDTESSPDKARGTFIEGMAITKLGQPVKVLAQHG